MAESSNAVYVRKITTKKAFNSAIAQPELSVMLFSAPWCDACKVLKPDFDNLSAQESGYRFYEINGDKGVGVDLADSLNVEAFPTVWFFKNGAPLCNLRGPSATDIASKCKSFTQ